ncbi:hypothetical protein CYY_008011 [Polysphondylium violaceum]|uniref:Uncharacterized protein n=1 Tax=Polysphondylium violaceum TaxID=133409 RepID=A0A8J4UQG9_9MYCE|nr:hypothetical protein CYY_008011 [Polysphondylium violaceum]
MENKKVPTTKITLVFKTLEITDKFEYTGKCSDEVFNQQIATLSKYLVTPHKDPSPTHDNKKIDENGNQIRVGLDYGYIYNIIAYNTAFPRAKEEFEEESIVRKDMILYNVFGKPPNSGCITTQRDYAYPCPNEYEQFKAKLVGYTAGSVIYGGDGFRVIKKGDSIFPACLSEFRDFIATIHNTKSSHPKDSSIEKIFKRSFGNNFIFFCLRDFCMKTIQVVCDQPACNEKLPCKKDNGKYKRDDINKQIKKIPDQPTGKIKKHKEKPTLNPPTVPFVTTPAATIPFSSTTEGKTNPFSNVHPKFNEKMAELEEMMRINQAELQEMMRINRQKYIETMTQQRETHQRLYKLISAIGKTRDNPVYIDVDKISSSHHPNDNNNISKPKTTPTTTTSSLRNPRHYPSSDGLDLDLDEDTNSDSDLDIDENTPEMSDGSYLSDTDVSSPINNPLKSDTFTNKPTPKHAPTSTTSSRTNPTDSIPTQRSQTTQSPRQLTTTRNNNNTSKQGRKRSNETALDTDNDNNELIITKSIIIIQKKIKTLRA